MVDLGNTMPMRMIGQLLGIPEQDQDAIKAWADSTLESKPGEPWDLRRISSMERSSPSTSSGGSSTPRTT